MMDHMYPLNHHSYWSINFGWNVGHLKEAKNCMLLQVIPLRLQRGNLLSGFAECLSDQSKHEGLLATTYMIGKRTSSQLFWRRFLHSTLSEQTATSLPKISRCVAMQFAIKLVDCQNCDLKLVSHNIRSALRHKRFACLCVFRCEYLTCKMAICKKMRRNTLMKSVYVLIEFHHRIWKIKLGDIQTRVHANTQTQCRHNALLRWFAFAHLFLLNTD